jgi:CheY-like chemotaxis protein
MGKPELSLFYYPTTTIYIDDNKDFLNSLTMKASSGSFKTFTDPHEGLVYIESVYKQSDNFFRGEPLSPNVDSAFNLVIPQNRICQKLNTLNRFAEPSVIVVDFSMPHLNGLDLCAQISNPNAKKILLTGVANEKQAIHALNSDLVDFYIGKNEDDILARLSSIIATLNNRYFMDLNPLSNQEAAKHVPYIFDSEFADYFEQICENLEVVEYYYVTNPGGFLLIDKIGTIHRLIVLTEKEYHHSIEELKQKSLPAQCLDAIEKDHMMPFMQNADGIFEPEYLKDWRNHVYAIETIPGNRNYFCSLISTHSRCLTSYQEYLDMPSNRLH